MVVMNGDELQLDGKKYISSKRASKISGYTKDYIGQLSRANKLDARLVGRTWYVAEDSLLAHKDGGRKTKAEVNSEKEERSRNLVDNLAVSITKQDPYSSYSFSEDKEPLFAELASEKNNIASYNPKVEDNKEHEVQINSTPATITAPKMQVSTDKPQISKAEKIADVVNDTPEHKLAAPRKKKVIKRQVRSTTVGTRALVAAGIVALIASTSTIFLSSHTRIDLVSSKAENWISISLEFDGSALYSEAEQQKASVNSL